MTGAAPAAEPLHICRSGRHCVFLTGITADGRCLACRRESHRAAQRRYRSTVKGDATNSRYVGSAKGLLADARANAQKRGA